jgi:hypothetical protein
MQESGYFHTPVTTSGPSAPGARLHIVEKRNISFSCQKSKVELLVVQALARLYTDWAAPAS